MTGAEIRSAAQAYIDEMIEDEDALVGINAGLGGLGDMALLYKSTALVTEADNSWSTLATDCTNVVEVRTQAGARYMDWKQRGDKIFIRGTGSYTYHYRAIPPRLAALTAPPGVHSGFHELLATYLAGWWKLKDDDENPDGQRLMTKFEQDRDKLFQSLRTKKRHKDFTVLTVRDGGGGGTQ